MQNRTKQVLATAVAACALFTLSRKTAAAPLSYTGGTYIEDFDSLSPTQSILTYPAPGPNDVPNAAGGVLEGWTFGRFGGTNTTIEFRVRDGDSTSLGHAGSYGILDAPDRALGTVATTASVPAIGFQLVNNTGGALNQFTLSYTGEQWRRGDSPAGANSLPFSFSTTQGATILNGTFTPVPELTFVAPDSSATTLVPLDGNAPENRTALTFTVGGFLWKPGETMTFRWNDTNETGADDWLAVDDLSFSATVFGELPRTLSWNTANLTGLWNTDTANKPWKDETPAASHFNTSDFVTLGDTSNDIDITVDSGGVVPSATNVTNATHKYTLSGGPISGQLNKSNAGTLVLKSPNTFSAVNIDGGTVETEVDNALGTVGINLKNGAIWKTTTNPQNTVTGSTVFITGAGTIDTQTDLVLNTSIQGANVIFTKEGPGLLWARHNAPLTGNSEIHVNGGTMRDSDDIANFGDGIPDGVILRIAAGATFDESFGNGEQFSALAGDGTYLGHRVANGSGHISLLNNTTNIFVFNGLITAGTNGVVGASIDEREILALRKNGLHTAVLTNPLSDFAGQVQVNNGVLETPLLPNRGEMSPIGMGNIASVPATPGADITFGTQGLAVDTAGALRYTGPSGSSDRSINLNGGSGAIEISNPAAALTLSGPITGSNNTPFQKTGPGALILTGDNTFGGSMDVVAGKLLVNNTTGSGAGFGLLSVKDGATLGGNGTISTNVYIQTGGTLAPGESIGTLSANASTIDPGAKLHWELNSTDGTSDLFNVNGSFDLLGQATIDFDELGTASAKTFTLIKYTGAVSNFANLLIGTTPNPSLTYTLVDNQANQSIDLMVSGTVDLPQWNVDASGSWSTAANWTGGIPNSATATANFLGKITAARAITLDGNKQVQQLVLDNANKYTITPGSGGTLTVGNGTTGSITTTTGTHEISALLSLSGNITKAGAGTLIISGTQTHTAGSTLAVIAGTVNLNSNAGSAASAGSAATSPLSITISGDGSKVIANADQNLRSLSGGGDGLQTFDLNTPPTPGAFRSIHIYAADLAAAKASLYSGIRNAIANSGDGILDSGLAAHSGSKLGLAQVADAHGDQNIFIRPTRVGDLNLDGTVTISDFIDLASNFNTLGTATWQEGDLNYDGNVTISDFIDLASNFNASYSGETFPISDADAQLLSNFAAAHGASVPEPATITVLALAASLVPRRRRRS
ncbi:MAG TPA: autotransporter-associated beta strand repeat-containing protein [Tepidisphaeraceae bacterium]|jgi:autotransporter-associated beta strand protein|nr:autotransporter-associated beta strand repeat-containing protein [Tepidisphaeraceae bacterium]